MDKKFIVSLALASSLISVASATTPEQELNKLEKSWHNLPTRDKFFNKYIPNDIHETNIFNKDLAQAQSLESAKINPASKTITLKENELNQALNNLYGIIDNALYFGSGFDDYQKAVETALKNLQNAQEEYKIYTADNKQAQALEQASASDKAVSSNANNTANSTLTNDFNAVNNANAKVASATTALNNALKTLHSAVGTKGFAKAQQAVDSATKALKVAQADYTKANNTLNQAVAANETANKSAYKNDEVSNKTLNIASILDKDKKIYQDNASNYQKSTGIWSFNNAYSNVKDSAQVVTNDEEILKQAIAHVKNAIGTQDFKQAQELEQQDSSNLKTAQQNFTNAQNAFNKVNDNFNNSMPFYASAWRDTSLINEYKQYAHSSNATIKADYKNLSNDVNTLTTNTGTGVHRLSWWVGLNIYSAKNQQQVLSAQKALKDEEQQFTKDKTILTQAIAKAQQSALNQVSNLNNALNSYSKILNANLNRYNQATSVWGLKSIYNTTKADAQSVNKDKIALQQAMKSNNVAKQATALTNLENTENQFVNAQKDLSQVLKNFNSAIPLYESAWGDTSIISKFKQYAHSSNATIKADYKNLSNDVNTLTTNTGTGVHNLSYYMGNKVFKGLSGQKALDAQQENEQKSFKALESEENQFTTDEKALENAIKESDDKTNDYLKNVSLDNDNQDDIDYSDRMDD
ncbi:hypothetical protein [Helicobacter cetorum]|uniref:hypothetical protein n=1 Tax=Helicobacter cetorum TaxID=138563 RepID=UPI000CF0B434|nr:hypothetical protein [Helicobacter cetorum]